MRRAWSRATSSACSRQRSKPDDESIPRGVNGDDRIVGCAGNDSLRGDNGADVCIGGGGTDTFHSSCEVQIQ